MSQSASKSQRVALPPEAEQAVAKVTKRLVWLLFFGAVMMSLDRTNVGFASAQLKSSLSMGDAGYAFTVSIFNIGYILAEVPSNLVLARVGAKIWIPRIMITWGLAATALAFTYDATSLYVVRFLLGAFEGGFLPGLVLYMSLWLPESRRAQAVSLILLGQPAVHVLGPALSGPLLNMDGVLGFEGWRWMFFVEGIPAVLLGIVAFFVLTDRPANAKWLSAGERTALTQAIINEEKNRKVPVKGDVFREIFSLRMLLLGLCYLGIPMSLASYVTWGPQIVRELLPAGTNNILVGIVTGLTAVSTVFMMPLWSRHSDRKGERKWHIISVVLLTIAGWLMVIYLPSLYGQLLGLFLAVGGSYAAQGIIFPFVTAILSPAARPAGIAVTSMCGLIGAAASPYITGYFRDLTGEYTIGLWIVVVMLTVLVAAVLTVTAFYKPVATKAA